MAAPTDAPPRPAATASDADRRNARLYLTGLAASLVGNGAMSLVAGIWVKELTGSSGKAGLVSVCVYAPSLLGPFAGLVADRARRRRWLLGLNLVSAAAMLPLLAVTSQSQIWLIFCVMTWYGIDLVLEGPAEDALFAEMLPLELRWRANGLRLGLQETGRLVAPLFGAGLFALAGGGSVAAFDAATFLVAALMLSRLRLRETRPHMVTRPWREELLAGLAHIRATAELRRVVTAAAVVMGVSGILVPAQFSLVQALGKPPSFLGVLAAGLGAGSIVASLLSSRVLRRIGERWLAIAGMVAFAAGTGLNATGRLAGAVAGFITLGFALPWVFLATVNLAQRRTPLALQGRVSAAVTLALFGLLAPLQALGALIIGSTGCRQLYLAGAAAALMSAAWLGLRGRRT